MVTKSAWYLRKDNTKLLSVLFCGSWPFDSSDDSSGHKTIHSTSAISPRDSFSCLSMIICRKHLIVSILHIIIRMLFWVGIGILERRIKLLSKFADQLTQSCPNFGSLGIGTRLGSGWVRRQRQISKFLILGTLMETFIPKQKLLPRLQKTLQIRHSSTHYRKLLENSKSLWNFTEIIEFHEECEI